MLIYNQGLIYNDLNSKRLISSTQELTKMKCSKMKSMKISYHYKFFKAQPFIERESASKRGEIIHEKKIMH